MSTNVYHAMKVLCALLNLDPEKLAISQFDMIKYDNNLDKYFFWIAEISQITGLQ